MIQIRDQKKMKRQIFKKLLLVFLILAMQIMLVSGTDQNALIRNLVEQRIEIMNAFFNGTLLEKDAAAFVQGGERPPASRGFTGVSRLFSN